jgi:hypothetical protein
MRDRIADLRELGFADPTKMIASFPEIGSLTIHNVRRKIVDLRELGFADPVKMITSFPEIAGLGINNIRGRIADLRQLGFADPYKMITSSPAILGLSINNIRGRIADLRELGCTDPAKMITASPAILGYARERLLLCGDIIKHLEDGTDKMLARLIRESRAVIDAVAIARPRTWSDVHAIIVAAKRGVRTRRTPDWFDLR